LRILHVNDRPIGERGGAEVNLARLIEAQTAAGDEPSSWTGEVQHTGAARLLDLWDPSARRRLRRRVVELRPDVVHLHNVVRELSPSVLGATGDVPVVMTVHDLRVLGGGEHHWPDPRAVADRWLLAPLTRRESRRHLAAAIAVSDTVAEAVRAMGLRHVVSVPVPVPPPALPPHPVEDCWDVVFAATLAPDKGAHVLLEAFGRIAERHPRARLVLAGDGPDRKRLAAAAAPWADRVLLPGRLDGDGVSAAMGRARIVVVPSLPALRREGSSLTAAEAARHARPVISSDDPAAAEVARSVGGDVVPAGDVQALADRLDHWLASPELAAAAGRRAESLGGRFDVASSAAQVREVYASVLAR
jgi:glycosyltransferase involved in cell wall biosynthesis